MIKNKDIKQIALLFLIGKLLLGFMLVERYGLKNIFIIEIPYLIITFLIFFNINKNIIVKVSLMFIIFVDIFNSILMNILFKATYIYHSYYFHPICAVMYLTLNYFIIKYYWLKYIINLYVFFIITYTFILFFINKEINISVVINHIIGMFFIIIFNKFLKVKKNEPTNVI